jgi:NAD(P)-dependent dehydrogenase (short-subunit alcohol dehydrogenase family)
MSAIIMGKTPAKLVKAEEAIQAEAKKRGLTEPTIYHAKYDLNDLTTALSVAEEATKISKEKNDGKLHVLVNNAGGAVPTYQLTKQDVEANVGRNFLAPYFLTEKMLPPTTIGRHQGLQTTLCHCSLSRLLLVSRF